MSQVSYKKMIPVVLLTLAITAPVVAKSVELNHVQFPEKKAVELTMDRTTAAPRANVWGEVVYKKGQAQIDLMFTDMKPAILYGGDITCYVLWAVTRDGDAENLGELVTRKASGRLRFSTGKKAFALLVTAEPYYLVSQPSDIVVFKNKPDMQNPAGTTPFRFSSFGPTPRHAMDSVAPISWDSKIALELLQARKAFEVATRNDAPEHAPQLYTEAEEALNRANEIAETTPKGRELVDVARRAVALSNEALNISMHRIEALEVERRLAERKAETEALERRAAEAEKAVQRAELMSQDALSEMERARREVEQVRTEKQRVVSETAALIREKKELESAMDSLRQERASLQTQSQRLQSEKTQLEASSARIKQERDQLNARLQAALSHVAETQSSARGFVVNLPDILFDVNEATLREEARLVLAKLAGILLIMPDQQVQIEGHTDSTGSSEYNLQLSQQRAQSVLQLLASQGLESERLAAQGFGMDRPVADNGTDEGRRKNRRVELVISEK